MGVLTQSFGPFVVPSPLFECHTYRVRGESTFDQPRVAEAMNERAGFRSLVGYVLALARDGV